MPDAWMEALANLTPAQRIGLIALLALGASLLVRLVRRGGEWLVTPTGGSAEVAWRRHPKFVTVATLVTSALTFTIYFGAVGLVLSELGFNLTAYLASASVIGLAIGFGSQGLVQDLVTGVTLIFSDVVEVGQVVDLGGQTGRVERIGLRYTVLVNLHDQRVYVPNRAISQINRYRGNCIRVYADVQVPEGAAEEAVAALAGRIARGLHAQHGALLVREPRVVGVGSAEPGGWRYVRVKFWVWPGQGGVVETAFRPRMLSALRREHGDVPDWTVAVTYRAD